MVSKDACLRIGRHKNWTDRFNSSWIGRHELLPQTALPGLQIETIDQRRQLAGLINVERSAVTAERDRLFPRIQSRNRPRIATSHRKKISLLVRPDSGHPLRVWRNHKRSSIHAFLGDGLALSRSNVTHIKSYALARFIPRKQNPLPV